MTEPNEPDEQAIEDDTCVATPEPRWRPAAEPTCCGSGCDDCPF